MQKTLEVLKNEDGLTICKLSKRKWIFKYKIPVRLEGDVESFYYINAKIRYFIDEERDLYLPLSRIQKLCRIISVNNGVPMNKISIYAEVEKHMGKRFSIIKGFVIFDKKWIRDFRIKKIFNEINNS